MLNMKHGETGEVLRSIGKCVECGTVARTAYPTRYYYGGLQVQLDAATAATIKSKDLYTGRWVDTKRGQAPRPACPNGCGVVVPTRAIKATETRTECGPICQSASGPACDCICKGENHGGGHA